MDSLFRKLLRVLSDRNLDWSLTWPLPRVTGWMCWSFCWHTWVMTLWRSYELSFQGFVPGFNTIQDGSWGNSKTEGKIFTDAGDCIHLILNPKKLINVKIALFFTLYWKSEFKMILIDKTDQNQNLFANNILNLLKTFSSSDTVRQGQDVILYQYNLNFQSSYQKQQQKNYH